jgi:DNA-binding GntR family transcriptional regulator
MNPRKAFAPLAEIARTTFRDHIAESLRASILNGSLPPGAPLVEGRLAQQFGVSRGPLREAMRQLTEEGLLTTKAYTATHVTQLTEKDVNDIYSLRTALEIFAFEQCWPLRDEAFFEQVRSRLDRLTRAIDGGDEHGSILAELELHSTPYEWAGNAQLLSVWRGMRGRIQLYWATHHLAHGRRGPRRDGHDRYVELACGNDLGAMKTEIRSHMRQGEKTTVAFIRDWSAKDSARSTTASAEPVPERQPHRGQSRSRPTSRTKEPT